jgi:Pyridine nucleotide-disulphide oxidoreductase
MASRIAVIGAGPHGLSIAAHLNARGLQPLVFGRTMAFWRESMPEGMKLNSDGFACDLSEPSGAFTLEYFCALRRLPYGRIGFPIPLETFIAYGEAFQRRFAPQVDERQVIRLERGKDGFVLTLDDGARIEASDVVVATGIGAFPQVPPTLARISPQRVIHSSALSDASAFARKRVLVVGAGASATDCAAALVNAGAEVSLVCRDHRSPRWVVGGHSARSLRERMMAPDTPVGPGWIRWAITKFPHLFRALSEWARVYVVDNMLGPAPAWFIRGELEGRIRILPGREILGARESEWGVDVELGRVGSQIEYFRADHVVLGTGYRVDLSRLGWISPALRAGIARANGAPKLQANFESSVPGLYFAGAMSANTFGPMMRFVCGADFAARRIAAAVEHSVGATRASGELAPAMVGLARQ